MLNFVQCFYSLLLLSASIRLELILALGSAADTQDYDYIVVGSGPGGGPLASNLARAGYSVLLLEAGDQGASTGGSYPPQLTWDFFVKHYEDPKLQMKFSHLTWKNPNGSYWVGNKNPPADAKLLGVYYPRGSSVGGSSMINAMMTWLPTANDWNNIANITGDASWGASNMRQIFQRLEHNNYLADGTAGHGFDGYLQTSMTKPTRLRDPTLSIMQATVEAIGQDSDPDNVVQMIGSDPNFLDPKRDQTEGVWGSVTHAYSNGTRYSSRNRILDTIRAKFPLTLGQNSLVTKILFDKSTVGNTKPRATGVEFLRGTSLYKADARYKPENKGTVMQAFAKKEVILAGGTYNSPQLLMLSGIGPSAQLKQFNISVLVDSPGVGNNLQINPEMPIVGQYQGTTGSDRGGNAMIKTPFAVWDERDMFIMQSTFPFRGYWPSNQTNKNLPGELPRTYALGLYKQHPQSRAGYVRLRSADPQDPPDINYNLYMQGNKTDFGAIKSTVQWARSIFANTAAPTGPVTLIEPACSSGDCDKIDEDWIISSTFGNHPVGSCMIGANDDKNAVLDSKFRVKGVDGLRVVDASVFPRQPGIFPVVATFMVSEKGSDAVLADAEVNVV